MTVDGTENTITVDANVINYYFQFINGNPLASSLRIKRMKDFCDFILNLYPIAVNDFIISQYETLVNLKRLHEWLAMRVNKPKPLAKWVEFSSLTNRIKNCLQHDYGFNCWGDDAKYLRTCINTKFKHLITENKKHFNLRHRARRRRPMRDWLRRELSLFIYNIDECCSRLMED